MIMNSLIIPVYKNEAEIPNLLEALSTLNTKIQGLEVVFVVDGSPDQSFDVLNKLLVKTNFKAQLVSLSKNFGAMSAIRAGLQEARGNQFAVMAADLQEPIDLIETFFLKLSKGGCDVIYGERNSRADPVFTKLASNIFWFLYRKFIFSEMPNGGVDVFGCNNKFKEQILKLEESHSSLMAIIFWLGYRRESVLYDRQKRSIGRSSWTFSKKVNYLRDSIFSFSNSPIILLTWTGIAGIIISITLGLSILYASISGNINVPGYAPTILAIIFFGGLNLFGIGIIGTYAWRTYENTKRRPLTLVMSKKQFGDEK